MGPFPACERGRLEVICLQSIFILYTMELTHAHPSSVSCALGEIKNEHMARCEDFFPQTVMQCMLILDLRRRNARVY